MVNQLRCIRFPLTTVQFSENRSDFIKLGVANVNPRTATSIVHIPQNTYVCCSKFVSFFYLLAVPLWNGTRTTQHQIHELFSKSKRAARMVNW